MPWTSEQLETLLLVVVLALTVALFLVLRRSLSGSTRRLRRPAAEHGPPAAEVPVRPPTMAVVVNPTKLTRQDHARARALARLTRPGQAPPLWLETTQEDPGHGQTASALAQQVRTVVAYGGDGTVRTVAGELLGHDAALAIVPCGTGNLLARNLGLPLIDLDSALGVALNGRQRRVDVALVAIDRGEQGSDEPEPFLVMAGIGFDAEVMAAVEPRLKARVGWWAYVVAGAVRLRGRRARVQLRLDDGPPLTRRARSVIIGNCGALTGGVRLLPAALVDDGWLDVVVVSPRGLTGWAAVTLAVLSRRRKGHPTVQHFRARRIEVWVDEPWPVQLDGDPAGTGCGLRAEVLPGALTVKVP